MMLWKKTKEELREYWLQRRWWIMRLLLGYALFICSILAAADYQHRGDRPQKTTSEEAARVLGFISSQDHK